MSRVRLVLVLGILTAIAAAQGTSRALFAQTQSETKYEVLSPWADVDPIPLKGISARVDSLSGKKIGIFVNYKRAARPIGLALEKKLKSSFPNSEISTFNSTEWNVTEVETEDREKFTAWAKGVDAVILLVGD